MKLSRGANNKECRRYRRRASNGRKPPREIQNLLQWPNANNIDIQNSRGFAMSNNRLLVPPIAYTLLSQKYHCALWGFFVFQIDATLFIKNVEYFYIICCGPNAMSWLNAISPKLLDRTPNAFRGFFSLPFISARSV
jgi:hypothetical protein